MYPMVEMLLFLGVVPDFKFKNNRDYPIKIEASYANSKLTCKIIGTNVDGSYVKFTSERTGDVAYNTKYENDATIPEWTTSN